MDWRSYTASFCFSSIMTVIVASGSNRRWSFCGRTQRKSSNCAGLWPNCNRSLLLTVAILLVTCLTRPIVCRKGSGELHLQDYAVLAHVRTLGSTFKDAEAEPTTNQPKLSELVTQSDVIFKAFAGHGNDLRQAALNLSWTGTPSAHRQQQQQHHHQPRWKPQPDANRHDGNDDGGADFIVRLEPGTVYKGNELFKQLQLNSWKHYFILWSNGSVQYTHHDVPRPDRAGFESSKSTDGTAHSDEKKPDASSASNAPPDSHKKSTKPNCMKGQLCQHSVESTPSAVTEVNLDDSSYERDFQPTKTIFTGDESIDATVRNLHTDRSASATSPSDNHNRKSFAGEERVNLQHSAGSNSSTQQEADTAEEQTVPNTLEKDLESDGQISRTLSKILPVTLIVFGRLSGSAGGERLLRVDPYVGLLRWDEPLEDALWQALGWSEWSDYTGCSVTCGGGVQQRFRHCLQSVPSDRVAPRTRSETNPIPVPVTAAAAFTRQGRHLLNSEIEISTTARTQPAPWDALPGVSIAPPLGDDPSTSVGRKSKTKLKSKQMADGGWRRQMSFPEKVNEKSVLKPSASEPISSEAVSQRTPTAQDGTVPLRERWFLEPAETTHHKRATDAAANEGTWRVCEGHNIEQRNCNMFDCTGTINLMAALTPNNYWRTWDNSIDDQINYQINQLDQNFTLMISLRLKPATEYGGQPEQQADDDSRSDPTLTTHRPTNGHIFSIRSKLTTSSSLSINFETDGHGGLRVLQEKYGLSEMLPVRSGKLTLRDGDWHSVALSARNGGFVTVYIDCQWSNSFVLTKGSIELPQYPIVEVGRNVELRQLMVVPGEKSAQLQCNPQPVPIHDMENQRVTNYFEHHNLPPA